MSKILNIDYQKYKLENGLEVILHENHNVPVTAVNLWYKVGSAVEKKGKTGLAHLFEHMMFQGSENVPKEMHFRFIQEAGGHLNGSTSFDRTNYYEKIPSNFLELVLWLESDRMGFLLSALTQEKLTNQIDVVKNERLERYDNQPYGLAWEIILKNIYPKNHPYAHPTIGYVDDILSYTQEDVINFFRKYYSPNNATMVIAGDIDISETKRLVEQYFGDLPNHLIHSVPNPDIIKREKYKSIVHKENVQLERLYLAWPTVKSFEDEDSYLEILADILTGSKNARLYNKLVYESEIAQDITAFQFSGKFGGHFTITATAKPGISLDKIKECIFTVLDTIIIEGIENKELQKSKNSITSSFIYSLQSIDSLADQLNYYNFYMGEPNSFNHDLSRYSRVEESNLIDSLKKYLTQNYFELRIVPNSKDSE